jgi:drug/metabolite transporter (DMT)-like permease
MSPLTARTPVSLDAPIIGSMIALGALGTGFAYIWNFRNIREWGPTRASTVTYLTPVIGVILGVLILGETLHWYEPVGGVIVIAGILASQRNRQPPQAVHPPRQPTTS